MHQSQTFHSLQPFFLAQIRVFSPCSPLVTSEVKQLRVVFLGNTLPFADNPESATFTLSLTRCLQLCQRGKKEKVETFSNSTTNYTPAYTILPHADRGPGKTTESPLVTAIFCLRLNYLEKSEAAGRGELDSGY